MSQLDVASQETQETVSGEAGVFQIRVRANHAWKVVLTAPTGSDDGIWVRVASSSGAEYRLLEPGMETVVATGERGEALVEVAYRWEPSSESIAGLPLIYTLASL